MTPPSSPQEITWKGRDSYGPFLLEKQETPLPGGRSCMGDKEREPEPQRKWVSVGLSAKGHGAAR